MVYFPDWLRFLILAILLVFVPLIFHRNSFTVNVRLGTPGGQQFLHSFYVDPNATGSNNGSSWANAWTSPASINWGSVGSDDVVYFSGGSTSQTYTTSFTVSASGTAGHPITIEPGQDAGHNGTVIFDTGCAPNCGLTPAINPGGNYIKFEGVTTGKFQINNQYQSGSANNGYGISTSGTARTGIVVDHMDFTNDGNPVYLRNSSYNTISNSDFHYTRGDSAIDIASSPSTGINDNKIFGNYIETVCQYNSVCDNGGTAQIGGYPAGGPDGIHDASASIYDNHFKEIIGNQADIISTQHPDMIQNQGNNTLVYNNDFENNGDSNFDYDAFAAPDAHVDHIYIYNNIFRIVVQEDPYPDFIRLYENGPGPNPTLVTNFKIMNNIFVDDSNNAGKYPLDLCYLGCPDVGGSGNEIVNNIFVNNGSVTFRTVASTNGTWASSWTVNHNVFSSGSANVIWFGATQSVNTFISGDATSHVGTPSFTNYTARTEGNNFHLLGSDTLAKDQGASLTSYFTTDKDGYTRTGTWDIGPYEYH